MSLSRRQFLETAAGALSLAGMSNMARAAQDYPARPVQLILGLSSGSSPDILARLMAQWLSTRLGRSFIVENHTGAGGTLAAGLVAREQPDGYSLLLITASNAIGASLYKNLDYDLVRDIAPVGAICTSPNIMVVNPAFPAKTIPEFIAFAKANPGKINMASAGIGTETHVAGELFKMMADIDMTHVPYRGGGLALKDLVAGQVDVMFPSSSSASGYMHAGTLRALGVSTPTRLRQLPGLPAIAEFLPGFEASGWFGIGAPKRAPDAIVGRLNSEINDALADRIVAGRLADMGDVPTPGSAADFGSLIAAEIAKWAKVIKTLGLKQS